MLARNQTGQMTASNPIGRANQAPSPGNRRNSHAVNGAAQRLAASETRYQRAMSSNQCIDQGTNLNRGSKWSMAMLHERRAVARRAVGPFGIAIRHPKRTPGTQRGAEAPRSVDPRAPSHAKKYLRPTMHATGRS